MEASMRPTWLDDARLIPDEVMSYLRKIAVRAVMEAGFSPEEVSELLGISRSSVYGWLKRFKIEGYEGLDTRKAPGAEPVVTEQMDAWLKQTVLESTPEDFGYETPLWTCALLAEVLAERFGVEVGGATVNKHLHRLGLSVQKPSYRAREQDREAVDRFVNVTFPKLQRLARRIGADILFEDEAGVDLRERSGTTWGARGISPKVAVSGRRGRLNILSMVGANGELRYHVTEGRIDSDVYIDFLKQVLKGRTRPLVVIADRASFHRSKKVRCFIAQNRHRIRLRFLPSYSPERNPDEHVWEEIKDKKLGRQTVRNKRDLKQQLDSALRSLQRRAQRVLSFFQLPETKYAAEF
jgi:transposase